MSSSLPGKIFRRNRHPYFARSLSWQFVLYTWVDSYHLPIWICTLTFFKVPSFLNFLSSYVWLSCENPFHLARLWVSFFTSSTYSGFPSSVKSTSSSSGNLQRYLLSLRGHLLPWLFTVASTSSSSIGSSSESDLDPSSGPTFGSLLVDSVPCPNQVGFSLFFG